MPGGELKRALQGGAALAAVAVAIPASVVVSHAGGGGEPTTPQKPEVTKQQGDGFERAAAPKPAPRADFSGGRIRGADLSDWQSDGEFQRATRNLRWASIKATEGNDFTDPSFKARWRTLGKRMHGKMMLRMAYHMVTTGSSGSDQAQHFLRTLRVHGKVPKGTVLALDWEADALARPDILRDAARHIRAVTGEWPVIYTSASNVSAAKEAVPKSRLWVAKWDSHVPERFDFVQTSDGPGYDHDVFTGNLAALEKVAD